MVGTQLEEEVTETRTAQIELDKTAVEFKNLHRERQEVLKQWEEAINNMERLDKAIQQANDVLVNLKVSKQNKVKA